MMSYANALENNLPLPSVNNEEAKSLIDRLDRIHNGLTPEIIREEVWAIQMLESIGS
jgi:hypothetical protein